MSEMDETAQPGEMPTEVKPQGEMPEAKTAATGDTSDELEQIRAALKKANNEAAKYRKAAELAEQEKKAREDAELSEMDKLKRQLAEYEAKLKQTAYENMQRKVAKEFELPDVLATRLQGEDEDAMREDAKALAATLPKKPTAATLSATNPSNGQPAGETLAQQRARVYGTGSDIFNPGEAAKLGGGVVFKDSK